MLEFFRRYQRGFFIVITVVIVISFSFFGTFQTFADRDRDDKVAFVALDGSKVRSSELHDMVAFLTGDSHDYLFSGGGSGNALNDGVLAADILESGLAQVIATPYLPEIGEEQQARLDREKRYKPYVHPKAPFLTSEQIWTYYAPDVKSNFDLLRSADNAKTKDAFNARVNLFVAERNFPAPYLKQFLRYQESSHKWLPQDPNLMHADLSLFGYHSTQDWFGRHFVELCAQFIINSAKIAEQKGFTITREEAIGSLYRNAEESFRELKAQGATAAQNVGEFFQDQLRRLGIDQSRAVKLWTDILLFRTLFFENADSVLVDTSSYKDFFHHLNEYVDIDLYQLPEALRFASMRDLQQFALYLTAVRPAQENSKNAKSLALPTVLASAQQVKKAYPELVERTYLVKAAKVNKESLETKVGVKATNQWQVEDKNWAQLKERYPELAKKDDSTRDARLKLLDGLDPARKAQIDTYSRQKIVEAHPEWLALALHEAPVEEKEITLREQGGDVPFEGFKNTLQLITLLDKAPLNEQSPDLAMLTQDNVHYVQLELLDRSKPERVLTFSEAQEDGTMSKLLNKVLESSYSRIRSKEPSLFLKENGEWKPFKDVKDQVGEYYFEDLFRSLDHEMQVYKQRMPNFTDWSNRQEAILAISLLPYVQEESQIAKEKLAKGEEWPDATAEKNQFALVKSRERVVRSGPNYAVNPEIAFSLEKESFSPLTSYQNSGACFFTVVSKGFLSSNELIRTKVFDERDMLGRAAVVQYAENILADMQKKGAYNLENSTKSSNG
ncbi:MAG: hypothetical protein JSR37_07220 [Verrucomicrobia bacterium]|nr:hypothetical protein [Verrucomicrobiota bacterium]MBS0636284.1 hypothetical protein [Verrucomicrobiota bacterium]